METGVSTKITIVFLRLAKNKTLVEQSPYLDIQGGPAVGRIHELVGLVRENTTILLPHQLGQEASVL